MKPLALLIALGVCALPGCGAHEAAPPDAGSAIVDAGPGVFLALERDFAGYRGWDTMVLPDGDTGQGVRRVYLNRKPAAGARTFPVGTILVKESMSIGLHPILQVDAMVKRGGVFNMDDGGAPGWEWMGLSPTDGGALVAWRGISPPVNGGYGGAFGGQCNACHTLGASNDFVQLPPDDAGKHLAADLDLSRY